LSSLFITLVEPSQKDLAEPTIFAGRIPRTRHYSAD